jgi:CelD/BcsL family acetyltransferase involved in cellulose biosynthesis
VNAWSVETSGCLAALREEWDDLFARCRTATPFQSHAWLDAWWRGYGVPGRLRVVLVRHEGRLVGAAAFVRERRGLCTVLTPLGGALSDFTDVLLDDAVAEPAARLLAAELFRSRDWDLLDFPETRDDAAAHRVLLPGWPGRHWRVPASVCLELKATPAEDLVRDLPGHARKTVRRRLNQIARLDLETRAVPAGETGRAVADLLRLHAAQWEGRGGNPEHQRPRFVRHLTHAVRGMVDAGQAAVLEYRIGGHLVASNLVVIGPDLAGGYLYGAEPSLRDRIDLATLLVTSTIDLAHERGCATMSMLRGAESYKQRWRPREAANQRILLARGGSLRARAYVAGVLARRRAVRTVKARLPWLRTVHGWLRR